MSEWQENLEKANKHFKIADHMLYVTFSLLKENRLMIKILGELCKCAKDLIRAILQYEYSLRRISLYKDPKLNLKTFRDKIALRYMGSEDLVVFFRILDIEKKHEISHLEFVKNEKFVIMLDDKYETLSVERLKEFIIVLKKVLFRVNMADGISR